MDNIGDILGKLSPEDIDALQSAAQELFGSNPPFADASAQSGQEENARSESTSGSGMPDLSSMLNADVIAKVSKIMAAMNRKDSRCDLINALKPHLSEPRRHKADEAIQIIKLLDLLPMLENLK